MPDSNKPENLLVVFSMPEMINQIRFRTKLLEVENIKRMGTFPPMVGND